MRRLGLRTVDGALFAVAAAFAAVNQSAQRDERVVLATALVATAVVAVLFLRRFPLPVVALALASWIAASLWAPLSGATPLAVAWVGLGVVAYRHGWAVSLGVAATAYAWTLVVLLRTDPELLVSPSGAVRGLVLAVTAVTPVVFGRYLRGLRDAARVAEERARDAERRRVAEAQAARLAERSRIAGDLHDIVAHHVSAIALQAAAGHFAVTRPGDGQQRLDRAATALLAVKNDAGQALVELRGLLQMLRDPATVPGGDGPALEPETMIADAVRRSRDAGLAVHTSLDERAAGAPLTVRVTAARVVQEALTNALKHAGPGAEVATTVAMSGAALEVEVVDSGARGPRPAMPESGHGLTGMRERVALLGGTLTAGPVAAGGWRLAVRLPLRTG